MIAFNWAVWSVSGRIWICKVIFMTPILDERRLFVDTRPGILCTVRCGFAPPHGSSQGNPQIRKEVFVDDWCAAAVARPSAYHPFCIVEAAIDYLTSLG